MHHRHRHYYCLLTGGLLLFLCLQFVLPLSVPTATSKSHGYGGGNCTAVKTGNDDDPPRPTEPVLPFFTLPDMPPLPSLSSMPSSTSTVVVPSLPPALPAPRISMPILAPVLPTFDRGIGVNRGYQHGGGVVVTVNDSNRNKLCGGIVAPVTTIDCFVGDQQQSNDECRVGEHRDGDSSATLSTDEKLLPSESSSSVSSGENHDQQVSPVVHGHYRCPVTRLSKTILLTYSVGIVTDDALIKFETLKT